MLPVGPVAVARPRLDGEGGEQQREQALPPPRAAAAAAEEAAEGAGQGRKSLTGPRTSSPPRLRPSVGAPELVFGVV